MGMRPARIYRDIPGQPYTRMSEKSDNDNYIKGAPAPKISIFETGDTSGDFDRKVTLKLDEECTVRSNALESCRVAANSYIKRNAGENNYHLKIRPYPHHVLRYHPLAGVAQADRYYEGMRKPFGRPIGRAAIMDEGQDVLEIRCRDEDVQYAKKAAERAGMKIPVGFRVRVEE